MRVLEGQKANGDLGIDVNALGSGHYLLQITQDNGNNVSLSFIKH